jgi:hypothetical protein
MSGSQKTTTTQSQNSQTSPWGPQAAALETAFTQAKTALGQSQGAKAPTDFMAQFTPEQLSTFRNMLGYANDSNVSEANLATGDTLANAGTSGLTGALSGLMGFNPSTARDGILTDAAKYADNPAISGMVDAAMRDANRNASEVVLPGIQANAAANGNINSNRTAISDGLVRRGLAEKTADISANLRGAAYDKGLDLGAMTNVQAVLDSLKSAGSLGGSAASLGIGARSGSLTDQSSLFDIANAGGAGLQAADQARIDEEQGTYQSQVSSPFDALQQYMNIVGSGNWGSNTTGTSTGTQKTTPSAWQVIGGLMGAGGSLAKGFGFGG